VTDKRMADAWPEQMADEQGCGGSPVTQQEQRSGLHCGMSPLTRGVGDLTLPNTVDHMSHHQRRPSVSRSS
jgi:hypothetical protein